MQEEEVGPVPNEWELRIPSEVDGPFQGHLAHLVLSATLAGDCPFSSFDRPKSLKLLNQHFSLSQSL
jgi:hypothetical protein